MYCNTPRLSGWSPTSRYLARSLVLFVGASAAICLLRAETLTREQTPTASDSLPLVLPDDAVIPEYASYDPETIAQPRNTSQPFDLQLEYKTDPLGVDLGEYAHLRVSWQCPLVMSADGIVTRGQGQQAYQIEVYKISTKGEPSLAWDSQRVNADRRHLVPLRFEPDSRTQYRWRVRIWDSQGQLSPWSEWASFETGLLMPDDWSEAIEAKWITSDLVPAEDDFVKFWIESALLDLDFAHGRKSMDETSKYSVDEQASRRTVQLKQIEKVKAPIYFRKDFELKGEPVRARLYVSGLGYHLPFINGTRLGDDHMAPSFVSYVLRAYYQVFDCTDQLKQGGNCVGAIVAPGRYNEYPGPYYYSERMIYGEHPILLARLEVEYADGSSEVIATDTSWQAGLGGYRRTGFWLGEAYDATAEPKGWSKPGFTQDWKSAEASEVIPPVLQAQPVKPVRENFAIKPISRTNPMPGVWVYDFGKVVVGKAQVQFDLPEGEMVRIRYSDVTLGSWGNSAVIKQWAFFRDYPEPFIREDAKDMLVCRARGTSPVMHAKEIGDYAVLYGTTDAFRSDGEPCEYLSSFDYTPFRYIEISTLEEPPTLDEVEAVALYSPLEPIGKMVIDDPQLQRIHDACLNSVSMLTHGHYLDNPGGEKMGSNAPIPIWNYDLMVYTFDHANHFAKNADDSRHLSEYTGVPHAITLTRRMEQAAMGGGSPFVNVNNNIHQVGGPLRDHAYFGDTESMELNLEQARLFWDYLIENDLLENGISSSATHLDYTGAVDVPSGPWGQGENARHLTDRKFARCCFVLMLAREYELLCEIAGRLDLWDDIAPRIEEFRLWVEDTYRDPVTNRYSRIDNTDSPRPVIQGTNVVTLKAELVEEDEYAALLDEIVQNMEDVTKGHQVIGVKSAYWFFELLSHYGYNETALRLLRSNDYPSIGRMLNDTGWVVAEDWGWGERSAFVNSAVQLEGLTGISNWFYREMVGIRPDVLEGGFKKFYLAPIVTETSPSYHFYFDSPQGMIVSELLRRSDSLDWEITVPPNSTAVVTMPVGKLSNWTESGQPLGNVQGISIGGSDGLRMQAPDISPAYAGRPLVTLMSGQYRFHYAGGQ